MVGSQAIPGTYREDQLPAAATMSIEIDVLPIAESNEETARLADQIKGVAGEFSPFEQTHGFSIDGVDLTTSALPDGWRDRLVKVQNVNTDQNFVVALLGAGLVDVEIIAERLLTVPGRFRSGAERARQWLAASDLSDPKCTTTRQG